MGDVARSLGYCLLRFLCVTKIYVLSSCFRNWLKCYTLCLEEGWIVDVGSCGHSEHKSVQ